MLVRKKSELVSGMVLAAALAFVGCSKDEQKPAEAVTANAEVDSPGTPDASASLSTGTVYFAYDDYTLSSDAQAELSKLAEGLKAAAGASAQLEGHCDERGTEEYNLRLGERRANSVQSYLTQLGVNASRLKVVSYGEEKPAVEGHDEAAWAKNRRVEVVVSGK